MLITDFQNIESNDLLQDSNTVVVVDDNIFGDTLSRTDFIRKGVREKIYGFLDYMYWDSKKNKPIPFKFGEYVESILPTEVEKLSDYIGNNPGKYFLIMPLGIGFSSGIFFFQGIRPILPRKLSKYSNVALLWNNLSDTGALFGSLTVRNNNIPKKNLIKKNSYLNMWEKHIGKEVDINRLDNSDIDVCIPNGIYTKELK